MRSDIGLDSDEATRPLAQAQGTSLWHIRSSNLSRTTRMPGLDLHSLVP